MRAFSAVLLALLVLLAAECVCAAGPVVPIPHYVPADTRVAILPFVIMTGEDMDELLGGVELADNTLAGSFTERGFPVVGDEAVIAAMAGLGMSVHDRAARTPETLIALAKAIGARLVVAGTVIDKRDTFWRTLVPRRDGRAAVRALVWDQEAGGLVIAEQAPGLQRGIRGLAGVTDKGRLQRQAVEVP